MFHRKRQRWPKGTYMRLASRDRLRTFVVTQDDIVKARKGQPIDPRKIPQRELSRRIGCNESLISHLTSGRNRTCTPETAARIAEVLGVDVTVLFDVQEPPARRTSTAKRSVPRASIAA